MNFPFYHRFPATGMCAACLAVTAFFFLASRLSAQSAENFKSHAAPAVAANPATQAAPQKQPEPPPANLPPARYVSPDEREAYIKTIAATFAIRTQLTDPFCLYQDPATRPVIKAAPVAKRGTSAVAATPLSEIVKLIKVTTVIPKENKFLIGMRAYQVNDTLALAYQGKTYNVQVSDVSSARIVFKNGETGETGHLPLDVMPPGMQRGLNNLSFPGIESSAPDAPLELAPGLPADDSASR